MPSNLRLELRPVEAELRSITGNADHRRRYLELCLFDEGCFIDSVMISKDDIEWLMQSDE